MNYEKKIVSYVSDIACKKITKNIIRDLKNMKESLQSGNDSGLKTIWDELCVQAKVEYSVMWDAYEDTMLRMIEAEIDIQKLDKTVIGAIFLQTDAGGDWEREIEDKIEDGEIKEWDQENVDYDIEKVCLYIIEEYIMKTAQDYTNKRIEKFIDNDGSSF
jgi:hypothetical protein